MNQDRMCKFLFLFALALNVFTRPTQAFLQDQDVARNLLTSGVPANVIHAARNSQTKEVITELILAAAPKYPLNRIFELYPSPSITPQPSKKKGKKESPGEKAFFEACFSNHLLYSRFFHALTSPYFQHDGKPYNPIGESEAFRGPVLATGDVTRAFYIPFQLEGDHFVKRRYVNLETTFLPFNAQIIRSPNYLYILKLLDGDCEQVTGTMLMRNPQKARALQLIRAMASLIRGELALLSAEEWPCAKAYLEKSMVTSIPGPSGDLIKLHLADLGLGVYGHQYGKTTLTASILNEAEWVTLLESIRDSNIKPFAQFRLAQYYLGFYGHKPQIEKGLAVIQACTHARQTSHLAYRLWAEYYLGMIDADVHDLTRAEGLLHQAYEACEESKFAQDAVLFRQGELALGLFDPEESSFDGEINLSSQSRKNVKRAIEWFERIGTPADVYLHRIYTGQFGKEYRNEEKARIVWKRMKMTKEYIGGYMVTKEAISAYNSGKIVEAVKLFERDPNNIISRYYLGCIRSNPKDPQHYDSTAALVHFGVLAQVNFRDVKLRFAKLALEHRGYKVMQGADINWYVQRCLSGKEDFTHEELVSHGFKNMNPELYIVIELPRLAPETEDTAQIPEQEEAQAQVEGETEATNSYLVAALEDIQPEVPVQSLPDPALQEMYDDIGSNIRWSKLMRVVQVFGGTIDMQKCRITFPHVQGVFTFHRFHSGNPIIDFRGYWGVLKSMLDSEYKALCREKNSTEVAN